MKFTCIPILGKEGGGVQWDADKNKVLARFDKNGECETDDRYVIKKLKELGYGVVSSDDEPEKEPEKEQVSQKTAKADTEKKPEKTRNET